MATINKHGVIEDAEVVVLASGQKYHLEARVAEHQGMWYAGASYKWGGIGVGACGGGWYPWTKNNPIPPQRTHDAAIDKVVEYLQARLRDHEKYWLASATHAARKATLAAIEALAARAAPKQLTMF